MSKKHLRLTNIWERVTADAAVPGDDALVPVSSQVYVAPSAAAFGWKLAK